MADYVADPAHHLQYAINRFWGTAFGTPIAEDGQIGPGTQKALAAVVSYTGGAAGFGIADVNSISSIAQNAQAIADYLNTIADGQGLIYDGDAIAAALSIPPESLPQDADHVQATQAIQNQVAAGMTSASPAMRAVQYKLAAPSVLGVPTWAFGAALGLAALVALWAVIRRRKGA